MHKSWVEVKDWSFPAKVDRFYLNGLGFLDLEIHKRYDDKIAEVLYFYTLGISVRGVPVKVYEKEFDPVIPMDEVEREALAAGLKFLRSLKSSKKLGKKLSITSMINALFGVNIDDDLVLSFKTNEATSDGQVRAGERIYLSPKTLVSWTCQLVNHTPGCPEDRQNMIIEGSGQIWNQRYMSYDDKMILSTSVKDAHHKSMEWINWILGNDISLLEKMQKDLK